MTICILYKYRSATEKYHPDITASVPIPARQGDVIFFSYYTIR